MKMRYLDIGSVSDIGKTRETNQDRILIKKANIKGGDCGMFAVTDGMGGLAQGEVSSSMAVTCLAEQWDIIQKAITSKGYQSTAFFEKEIISAFLRANSEIILYGKNNNIRLGTTISLLFIWKNKFLVCHTGDSRIYRINKSKFEMLTSDQTWAAQQINKRLMTYEEAMAHPNSHMLSSCIGILEDPEIITISGKVRQDDVFLICSDGFYRFISQEEIIAALNKNIPVQQSVLEMTGMVMSREATDNISAVLIKAC